MRIYLLIAAIAGGVTWLVTPLIRHVAIEIGAVGEVRARDVHTIPTPRMGGLGMLIGFCRGYRIRQSAAFSLGIVQRQLPDVGDSCRRHHDQICWAWPMTCGISIGC